MREHRAPIHPPVAKKSEVAYGEPLNGSPAVTDRFKTGQ
jgi:hypothetical protein